jgi:hypothetical protein
MQTGQAAKKNRFCGRVGCKIGKVSKLSEKIPIQRLGKTRRGTNSVHLEYLRPFQQIGPEQNNYKNNDYKL